MLKSADELVKFVTLELIKCPKCLAKEVTRTYCEQAIIKVGRVGYLASKCDACGHKWNTETADADK